MKKLPFSTLFGILFGTLFGLILIKNELNLFIIESVLVLTLSIITLGETTQFLSTIERVKNLFYTSFIVAIYTYFCFQINFFALMLFPLILAIYSLYKGIILLPSMIKSLEK